MRAENRISRRHSIYNGARIATPDGGAIQYCRMLDISATGARLQVRKDDNVPDKFILLLSHDGKLRRECVVVWRNKNTLGVHFV